MSAIFENILILLSGSRSLKGSLNISKIAGFQWKSPDSPQAVSIDVESVEKCEWIYTTKGYKIRVWHGKGKQNEFVGFSANKYAELGKLIQDFVGKPLVHVPTSTKGFNWGELQMDDHHLSFVVDETLAMEVPMKDIKSCTAGHRLSELTLEFKEEGKVNRNSECLAEMRFAIPKEEEKKRSETMLEIFKNRITELSHTEDADGESIVVFSDAHCLSPRRGRYTIELFTETMRLRGTTHDFKISYSSMASMYLLKNPDGRHMYFVVNLKRPVRQGSKPYSNIVLQFDKTDVVPKDKPIKLNISEEVIKRKYANKQIKTEMSGKKYEVVGKVFKALSKKKLIGGGSYVSMDNQKAIKCNIKAHEGHLFVLEKSFFFLHLPTVYIKHENIHHVELSHGENQALAGTRFFEIIFHLKKDNKKKTFSNIPKREEENLVKFLKKKGLRVEGELQRSNIDKLFDAMGDEDSEEDEDFEAESENEEIDDEEFDKYTTKKRKRTDDGGPEKKKRKKEKDEEKKDKGKKKKDKKDKKDKKKDKKDKKSKKEKKDKKDKKEKKEKKDKKEKKEKKDKPQDKSAESSSTTKA